MNHIENVHGDVRSKSGSLSDGKPKTQVSMNSFLNTATIGKISQERQEQIDDALCKFIAGKVIPVSVVDNELFRKFVGHLDPR